MNFYTLFSSLILFSLFVNGVAFKILVYSPAFGYSHMKFVGTVADILVDAGHQVVGEFFLTCSKNILLDGISTYLERTYA